MRLPRPFARTTTATGDSIPTPSKAPPRGSSGRWHTQGYIQQEELNADLQHPHGHQVYDRMWRTDPDVRRSLGMALNPILGGTWTVEPYGGDQATDRDREVAAFVQWALFEYMRPGLLAHFAEALPLVSRSGFVPFEEAWTSTTYKGKTVLVPAKLMVRLPRSVHRWMENETEDLTAIEQFTLTKGLVTLPTSQLVYYRAGAEGNNWEGTSLLRPVYKPWYLKDNLERIDAIAQELEATGLPVIYPPNSANTDPAILDDLEEKMANIRAGDTAYLIMPGPRAQDLPPEMAAQGWHFEIQGRGGTSGKSGRDASPSLQYHRDAIAAGLIAEFMRLGQSGTGARATADVQQDPFYMAVEGFASTVIEDTLNHGGAGVQALGLVQRLAYLNFDGIDGPPQLSLGLIDNASLTELKDFVQGLMTAGVLFADDELEDYLRQRADLPPADPKARADRRAMEQAAAEATQRAADASATQQEKVADAPLDPAVPAKPPGKPAPKQTASRQSRPLRSWERHMSLDKIEEAIDGARAQFQAAGADSARTAAATIAASVAAGDIPDSTPPDELVQAVHGCLEDLYMLGRTTVSEELASQAGRQHSQQYAAEDIAAASAALARRAGVAARGIINAITNAVLRRGVQAPAAPAADLQQVAEQAAESALKAEATLHAAPALNAGRAAEAEVRAEEIKGSRYTSILDGNRCEDCAQADDDVLRPLSDPVRLSRRPPNPECDGGDRCRCLEFYELKDEEPASG